MVVCLLPNVMKHIISIAVILISSNALACDKVCKVEKWKADHNRVMMEVDSAVDEITNYYAEPDYRKVINAAMERRRETQNCLSFTDQDQQLISISGYERAIGFVSTLKRYCLAFDRLDKLLEK